MRKIFIVLMIICAVSLSSCNTYFTSEATIIPTWSGNETPETYATPTPYIVNWSSSPLGIDASFDDMLRYYETVFDFDIDTMIQEDPDAISYIIDKNGHQIVFIPNYYRVLEDRTTPDAAGIIIYNPAEIEYHIIRRLRIDGIIIDEFENEQSAMTGYCIIADQLLSGIAPMEESMINEGFYYVTEELHGSAFHVGYYWEDISLHYTYYLDNESADNYNIYLSMCEEFGLPTCQEITEEIIGNQ